MAIVTDSAVQHSQPKEQFKFHAVIRRFDTSGGRVVVLATEGLFALPSEPDSAFMPAFTMSGSKLLVVRRQVW